ncbi:MAG: 4Fe-4S dicluster domain-containing protein [Anaerolineae bacterium]|nr:MAG: 4Fe-4S dicluster domain-containing protein [Anaerolineae bacterium]
MRLLASFGDGPPAVDDNLCLNRRYKAAGCQICAAACPVEAITVFGPNIDLNEDACARCGLCLNVCPTQVFSSPRQLHNDKKLLDSAASYRTQPLELTCPVNPKLDRTAAPVDVVLQTGRCLAALSLGELLDLAHTRDFDLWLNDSHCATCLLGKVLPAIHTTAAQANRLLEAWQVAPRLHVQTTSACIPVHTVDRVADQQPCTRARVLHLPAPFSGAGRLGHCPGHTGPAAPDLSVVPPIDHAVLPLHRRRLVAALDRLGSPPTAPLSLDGLPGRTYTSAVSAPAVACARGSARPALSVGQRKRTHRPPGLMDLLPTQRPRRYRSGSSSSRPTVSTAVSAPRPAQRARSSCTISSNHRSSHTARVRRGIRAT